jgi:hypothetical protein
MAPRVFVSHSSANATVAKNVGSTLKASGFSVWLDSSDIPLGMLLRSELHEAIRNSRAVALLWSQPASKSRWVAADILTAFHMDRFIIPCVVDVARLPEFLGNSVYLDLRKNETEALGQLARAVKKAPRQANPIPPRIASASAELKQAIYTIAATQEQVTTPLMKRDVEAAAEAQKLLDPIMKQAERVWRYELMVLNLGGYHRKNGYMVKHWDAIQAGRPPKDPLLHEGERLFFEALFVDPLDVSALNGLGSILIYERELDAAEFFVQRAIALSKQSGQSYSAAELDLKLIETYKGS